MISPLNRKNSTIITPHPKTMKNLWKKKKRKEKGGQVWSIFTVDKESLCFH